MKKGLMITSVLASLALAGTVQARTVIYSDGTSADAPVFIVEQEYAALGADPVATQESNVFYTSGGVGQEEVARLEANAELYNMKLLATTKDGQYVSDVFVQVMNAQSGEMVLETITEGPMLYVELEPGKYKVRAWYEGEAQDSTITIGENTKLRQLHMRWDNRA